VVEESGAGVIRQPEALLRRSIGDAEVQGYLSVFGTMPEPFEAEGHIYWSFYSGGVAILAGVDHTIQAVFLYAGGHEGYAAYSGPLPWGVRLDLTQSEFHRLLGAPAFSMQAREVPFLGRKGPMERYDRPALSLHVEFSAATGQPLVLCLMAPNTVPSGESSK
jgi:hypothetical protein